MNKAKVLNQHSALTTFKINNGKYYNAPVEKAIFALLLREQHELRKIYKENFNKILDKLKFEEPQRIELLENIYSISPKTVINIDNLPIEKANSITKEIITFREKDILDKTSDPQEIEKLKNSQEIKDLRLLYTKGEFTDKEKQLFVTEIKKYCKDMTIKSHTGSRTIDFTSLAKSLDTNPTRLKKEVKNATKTVLEFNYINRKNIDVEVITNLIAYVKILYDKAAKTNWMEYQIPIAILELLLLPSVYVPLEEVAVSKISGPYTMRMYSLLKDHLAKGDIELTKDEIFNFFMLPKSYQNKTNIEKKFIIPTLKEVEDISGIQTEYEFRPKNKYKSIIFFPKLRRKVKAEKLEIIDKKEVIEGEILKKEQTLLEKKISKVRRNIYASKAWNKRVDNKIAKIVSEEGEDFALQLLDALYECLNDEIQTTLVQYINGMLKKFKPKVKKKVASIPKDKVKTIKNLIEPVKEERNLKLDNFSEKEIEEAIRLTATQEGTDEKFLYTIRRKSAVIFFNTIKNKLMEIQRGKDENNINT